MNTLPEAPNQLDQLVSRLLALELRVDALEHSAQPAVARVSALDLSGTVPQSAPSALAESGNRLNFTGGLSALGAALLGIAGAYLLRAISGASLLPRDFVAAIAAVYAAGWLFAAARITSHRFGAALYATTSIFILAPMLWEMSIDFRAIHAAIVATVLALYAAIAMYQGRSSMRSAIFSVAFAGAACTAIAISIGTHQPLPFAVLLLAMVAASEATPIREQVRIVRILVVICADLALWMLIFIYRLPAEERADYPPLAPSIIFSVALILFLLQVTTLVYRSILRLRPIPLLQLVQSVVAFMLLLGSTTLLFPDSRPIALGLPCLLLGTVCIAAAYGPLRNDTHGRNFFIFAGFGTALTFAAAFLLAPIPVASVILATAGPVFILLGRRMNSVTVELQGVLYLSIAAVASGFLVNVSQAFIGPSPATSSWVLFFVAIIAGIAYAVADELPGETVGNQVLHLVPCLLAAAGFAAITRDLLVSLVAPWIALEVFHVAVLRTISLCTLAILLAFAGARLRRLQMTRVAYITLAVVVTKLLFEDLRHGHLGFIAASISLVAVTFLAVPGLSRAIDDRNIPTV